MSEQDALVERVAEELWKAKEQRNKDALGPGYAGVAFADAGDERGWWMNIAREAIAAVRAEGLEAPKDIVRLDSYRQVGGGWRTWAHTRDGQVNQGGATLAESIRAAVAAALGETTDADV